MIPASGTRSQRPSKSTTGSVHRAQQRDLLLDPPSPVSEVLPQGLVLDVVPADADAEPEAPGGQHVDLGSLLGDQCGLPLRQHEHPGHQLDPLGQAGEIAEQDEGLVERVTGIVGTTPAGGPGEPGAEDVVEHQQMGVAQPLGGLGEVTHEDRVVADLGLREHHSGAHRHSPPGRSG